MNVRLCNPSTIAIALRNTGFVVLMAIILEGGGILLFQPALFAPPLVPANVAFTLANRDRHAATIVFNSDATGNGRYVLTVHDLDRERRLNILVSTSHKCVAGHPRLPRFYASTWDGEILVVDVADYSVKFTPFAKHPASVVGDLLTSPDGHILIARGRGLLAAWNSDSGELLWQKALSTTCLQFAQGGERLFCGQISGDLVELDPRSGNTVTTIPSGISPVALSASPDGDRLVSYSNGGRVAVWNVATRSRLWSLAGRARGAPAFTSDGQFLVVPEEDRECRSVVIRTVDSGASVGSSRAPAAYNRVIAGRDGTFFAWGRVGAVRSWRVHPLGETGAMATDSIVQPGMHEEPSIFSESQTLN